MQALSFTSAGISLVAYHAGSGPVVVMLHGGMANHEAALPFVAPLTDAYHVVVPDVRGNGRSWFGGPLSFDQLADDVVALLDHLQVEQAVVGGVSGGSGVALRTAIRHGHRLRGLVLIQPVYAGAARGYTAVQRQTFAMMDAVASRALAEGVQVLAPMYAQLPEPVRARALEMLAGFDAASVVATSRFIASGAQPFDTDADLAGITVPTLLVRGDDPLHPREVSDLYAHHLPQAIVVPPAPPDVSAHIRQFLER